MLRTPRACRPAYRTAACLVLFLAATAARAEAQTVDLSVTKADSPDPVIAGTNLTYTITVMNAGPNTATSAAMTDTLPAGTTFVSMSQGSGPAATLTTPAVGGTGMVAATWASLLAGASATFTLVVNVSASAADGSIITNSATVVSATADPNLANNLDTETTTVVAQADLAVTKADSPDPVIAGTNLTYTITVTNNGPAAASVVTMADTIPANTTFVSMSQGSGPAATLTTPAVGGTGTVTATWASLAAGATATFTLVVNVNSGTPNGTTIANTATLTSPTVEPNPANNVDTEATAVGAGADLAVTKTDSPDPVAAGSTLTYAITVASAGPAAASTVTLSDAVPGNTTFVSLAQNSGPAATLTTPAVGGTGTVTATWASFAAGATATFTLVVNVNAGALAG